MAGPRTPVPHPLSCHPQFEIPQPFTRAAISIGEPLFIPEDADDETLPVLSDQLETVLNDLTAQAEVEAFAETARAQ